MASERTRPYSKVVSTPHLPPDPSTLPEARAAAEQAGDDVALFRLRELELAHAALPPVIDGARRSRLLHTDAVTTTWEAWSTSGGQRLFLRCLRPSWREDPVMRRRMAQAVGRVLPGAMAGALSWHPDGDWPHLRIVAEGALVVDRFPIEDAPITGRMARLLGGGLESLQQLHTQGVCHRGPLAPFLLEQPSGAAVAWMDVFGADGSAQEDISALARVVADLDPTGLDPVGRLAHEWSDDPPPTAADGVEILVRILSSHLLAARHQLAVAGRKAHKQDRATRLAGTVRRLATTLAPPTGHFCLKASRDGVQVLAHSDGSTVRGGAAAGEAGRFLPVVYTPDQGLDAQAARFLMRAWATREIGDPLAREVAQATLQAEDSGAKQLMRWLSCMARLRSARLLLEAAHRTIRAAS